MANAVKSQNQNGNTVYTLNYNEFMRRQQKELFQMEISAVTNSYDFTVTVTDNGNWYADSRRPIIRKTRISLSL